ncbi:MAG TPA: ABC transporter permease [Vicinamibacterales bacterium]|nr:ABC transporter permease [Vicinamibacterales bacterium]
MPSLARMFVRLASLLVPGGFRREFRDEWNAELAWQAAARQGASRAQYLLRASGAVADAVALFFHEWSLDMLMQDVRYALRLATRRAGFTALIVLILGLGIGANTALFSVINAVLLRPMPYHDPERLFVIWEDDQVNAKPRYSVAPANFMDWMAQSRAFGGFCAFVASSATLADAGQAQRVAVAVVWPNFNTVTGVAPLLGRGFTAEDGKAGNHRVLLVSHAAWQQRFGGDPHVVGRQVRLNDADYEVVGVMPRRFSLLDEAVEFWRPMVLPPAAAAMRAQHFLTVIGRLEDGATLERARAEMEAIAARAQQLYPATNDRRGVTLVPIAEQTVGDLRQPLHVVAAAVGIVLLIGCANVANLLLAAGHGRRREFAVRAAIGAGRARLVRQVLTEGLLLAALGGGLGLALALSSTPILAALAARFLPRLTDVMVEGRVFAFAAAASLATGLLFGLLPALQGARSNVQRGLAEGGRAGQGPGARRLGSWLVIAELALAVVLVTGASLAIRSFQRVQQVPMGFNPAQVLTADMQLPPSRYGTRGQIYQFHAALTERLTATPGVRAAGITNVLPLTVPGPTTWLTIEGQPRHDGEPPEVSLRAATPGYFDAMQIPLQDGVMFPASQPDDAPRVALINRALAERFFAARNPVGTRVRLGPNPNAPWRTVVGVVGDVHHDGLERPAAPAVYMMWSDYAAAEASIAVRVDGDPAGFGPALRAVLLSLDSGAASWRVRPMSAFVAESSGGRRASVVLLGTFAALALLLAIIGVYGVMTYAVSQRVPEIGVRMALGADPGQVLRMVVRQGMLLALAGLAVGTALALAAAQLVQTMLFGVQPTDRVTFAAVAGSVLLTAALACYIPARRASRIDPVSALRQ